MKSEMGDGRLTIRNRSSLMSGCKAARIISVLNIPYYLRSLLRKHKSSILDAYRKRWEC